MNDPRINQLREAAWRRKLTAAEEAELRAWLAAHPEAHADWEGETALTHHLARLPQAPMPSNFTVRVLQAVERAVVERPPTSKWSGRWRSLLPRTAVAALAVAAGLFAYQETVANHQSKLVRTAQSVAVVTKISSLPSPEGLQDYDAIRQLSLAPAADPELMDVLPWLQ